MTFHFKIQLKEYKKPEVWRQVSVPSNYSFLQLHKVINIIFGKQQEISTFSFSPLNSDYNFRISSMLFSLGSEKAAKTTLLSSIFKKLGQTLIYIPDLEEQWTLHIILERIAHNKTTYPESLAGEGAYPPETCEGIEDYEEMKKILLEKEHPQYKSTLAWLELNEDETWEERYKFDLREVNEQLMNIDAPIKSFRKYTVVKHHTFDEIYGLTPELWNEIDKKNSEFQQNKNLNRISKELENLANRHPNIPHFKNMLAAIYMKKGDKSRFFEMSNQLFVEYPNYIIARCNLIKQYLEDDLIDEAEKLVGRSCNLSELYPNRNGRFTEVEIYNYHVVVFKYLLKINNKNDAENHLTYLEHFYPEVCEENRFRMKLQFAYRSKNDDIYIERKEVEVIPERIAASEGAPDFENPEVKIFYEKDAFIEREILKRIMELPRASLIRDMEKILIDSVERFNYFEKNSSGEVLQNAPIHALIILSAFEAEEALDSLFTVLRQDSNYYYFWYGDMLTEDFWRYIYMMGKNRLDKLKDFIFEPHRYTYARTAVSSAIFQLAFNQNERKNEVLKWHEETLRYLLDHQDDHNVLDTHVYDSLLNNFIDVAGKEQLPIIMSVYDEKFVDQNYRPLSLYLIKKYLVNKKPDYRVHNIFTTIEQYYDEWQRWYKNNDTIDAENNSHYDFLDDEEETLKPFIAPPKVGRNDPCPCGSGKKYKKCCGR